MTFKMFVYEQVTNNPGSKQFVLIQEQQIVPVDYTLTTKYDPSSEEYTLPKHSTCCFIGFKCKK